MDIGTGKDLEEYNVNGEPIPYHLIDIKNPGEPYNIAAFQLDFIDAYTTITNRGRFPILCGGSGLYIETALKGQDFLGIPGDDDLRVTLEKLSDEALQTHYAKLPQPLQNQLQATTHRRKIRAIEIANFLAANPTWKPIQPPKMNGIIVGVNINRDKRRAKITKRLNDRLNNGMIDEVEFLLENYLTHQDLANYGLEYKWVGRYLKGEITKKQLAEQLMIGIHQFAKRQMTWFRRMEKKGYTIHWVDAELPLQQKTKEVLKLIIR